MGLGLALTGALVGCKRESETKTEPATADAMSLTEWLDARYEEELDFSPIAMTMQGIKKRYDEVDDFSIDGQRKKLEWKRKSVDELKKKFPYEGLSEADKISYDVWVHQYETMAEGDKWMFHNYVFEQMSGAHTFLATFLINFHRVDEPSDLDAYVRRIGNGARSYEQLLSVAEEGVKRGTRYPRFALEAVAKESKKIITGQPFNGSTDSDLWADLKKKTAALKEAGKIDEAKAEATLAAGKKALLEDLAPVYERIIAWADKTKAQSPEVATGVGGMKDGAAYYAFKLKEQTTTDMTAEEVHALGLAEVKRIHEAMQGVMKQVKFEGTLQEFFTKVRTAEWNYYPNTDEGRQGYIDDAKKAIDNIRKTLPEFFGLRPKADLVVKRVEPFREQDGAAQHYYPGTPDGSRPGIYYAHLSDMSAMPKNQLEVIAYHEGIPGHHMQIAIAQELEGVPKFRTQAHFTAYTEGWALYAEYLAKEMPGTYQDPYSEFGRLTSELFRAIRLVVDTGLHAKGWTEDEAIDYFSKNSPEPLESVRSEVQRYIVIPGQATSYKVGMIEIQKLRTMAKQKLGSAFDIKGFHDAVLGGGSVPLDVLTRQVNAWVEQTQPATR